MSDETIVTDETFDINGNVVATRQRTVRQVPTIEQLRAIRLELRNIAAGTPTGGGVVPAWGRTLARAIQWLTVEIDTDGS